MSSSYEYFIPVHFKEFKNHNSLSKHKFIIKIIKEIPIVQNDIYVELGTGSYLKIINGDWKDSTLCQVLEMKKFKEHIGIEKNYKCYQDWIPLMFKHRNLKIFKRDWYKFIFEDISYIEENIPLVIYWDPDNLTELESLEKFEKAIEKISKRKYISLIFTLPLSGRTSKGKKDLEKILFDYGDIFQKYFPDKSFPLKLYTLGGSKMAVILASTEEFPLHLIDFNSLEEPFFLEKQPNILNKANYPEHFKREICLYCNERPRKEGIMTCGIGNCPALCAWHKDEVEEQLKNGKFVIQQKLC
jgi:hypothetical protein